MNCSFDVKIVCYCYFVTDCIILSAIREYKRHFGKIVDFIFVKCFDVNSNISLVLCKVGNYKNYIPKSTVWLNLK